ncbi:MAG: hypothetical protein HGA80_04130 [Candidatus Omnitrophica bacterium]|nr:hypothetical protein [Candidatus Omnitrophota bacterium]
MQGGGRVTVGCFIARALAILAALFGTVCIGGYLWTVVPLFIHNAPDKSLAYWYLAFLFMGIAAWKFARFLWIISSTGAG